MPCQTSSGELKPKLTVSLTWVGNGRKVMLQGSRSIGNRLVLGNHPEMFSGILKVFLDISFSCIIFVVY